MFFSHYFSSFFILAKHSKTWLRLSNTNMQCLSLYFNFTKSLQVTSSGVSGGGQDLASSGSCLQQFHLPTFIECLGRGTCAYYINNLDYWLGQNPDITQPGMWGMGNVYSGLDEILDQGVARCTVCTRNAIED